MPETPLRRFEVHRQRTGDNHEALEPHPDVDEDRDDEQRNRAGADARREQRQRDYAVTRDHHPEHPSPWPEVAPVEGNHLARALAVPGHERLDRIAVPDDEAGKTD